MSDRRLGSFRNTLRGLTTPILLALALAASLFLGDFLVVAGLLAGACLVVTVVRWMNQRDHSLHEVGEIVLRNEAPDANWIEEFRRKRQQAIERELRDWRTNALAVWIFVGALVVLLLRQVWVYLMPLI